MISFVEEALKVKLLVFCPFLDQFPVTREFCNMARSCHLNYILTTSLYWQLLYRHCSRGWPFDVCEGRGYGFSLRLNFFNSHPKEFVSNSWFNTNIFNTEHIFNTTIQNRTIVLFLPYILSWLSTHQLKCCTSFSVLEMLLSSHLHWHCTLIWYLICGPEFASVSSFMI